MERAISAADANRKFSQLRREVREGQSYVVTSHGEPVARIAPLKEDPRTMAIARSSLLNSSLNCQKTHGNTGIELAIPNGPGDSAH